MSDYATINFAGTETTRQRLDLALDYLREHTEHDAVLFAIDDATAAFLERDGRLTVDTGAEIRRYAGIDV